MDALRVIYDLAVIVLALLTLVVALGAAAVLCILVFLLYRFSRTAVAGAQRVRGLSDRAHGLAQTGLRRGVAQPVAKAAGAASWLGTFWHRALDE